MRPPLTDFGGHPNFDKYQSYFRHLYSNSKEPVLDVMGRRVQFDVEALDDAAHVCYGGLPGQPYNERCWSEARAQRIGWIILALTSPNRVHPDKSNSGNEKYLLFVKPDDELQDNEWYCVIVRRQGRQLVSFLTAYPISRDSYYEYGAVSPRIWPSQDQKKKKKKHK
jgi:hypothetical protein